MKLWFVCNIGILLSIGVINGKINLNPERKRHTAYTHPLPLRQGEVTNTYHDLPIPKGPIAVYQFQADIVEKDKDGNYIPVPIYDAYLHHHVVGSSHKAYKKDKNKWTPMKPGGMYRGVGFGAGTESRGTPQKFYYPFAFTTQEGEDTWVANVHVLNTRNMKPEDAHHCLECPCTSEDKIVNGKLNNVPLPWDVCNAELVTEKNNACFLSTYKGGLRCCEHGEFCLEKNQLNLNQKDVYYLRYTIEYAEIVPENRPLSLAGCCDASGNMTYHGAIEYDIPKCDVSTNPGCVHTLSTRQMIGGHGGVFGTAKTSNEDKEIDVVYAVGHQHRGGLGLNMYDDKTGELICSSIPEYGKSKRVGDEKNYVVSMSTCTFNPPLRMRTTDVVRVVSLYNSTVAHTGVMGLFYIATADVDDDKKSIINTLQHVNASSFSISTIGSFFAFVGIGIGIIFSIQKYRERRQYQPLLVQMQSHSNTV